MGPTLAVSPKRRIYELLERETGATNVSESTTLASLGIDSLEFVSLMQCISNEIKKIPESRYHALDTVGDLIAAIV
jgi:acyl carrier protein